MGYFKIGDKVMTTKGCRIKGPSGGTIIDFSMWRDFKSAKIRKEDGTIKIYLVKNLYKTKESFKIRGMERGN